MNNLNDKLDNINNLKKKIEKLNPLSDETKKSLKIYFNTAIINNSIRGKGNTITQQEIKEILFDGKKINGKVEKDVQEITDYEKALEYVEELAKIKITDLNETNILNIHTILFKHIAPEQAGKYRNCPSWVSLEDGEKDTVCEHSIIPDEMTKYFNWLFTDKNEHPIIIAAEAHNRLVSIHPFYDGNGRTGRLIMNLILMQNCYAPIIIKNLVKKEFGKYIKLWRNNIKDNFYNFIAACEEESLEEYLRNINQK